MIRYALRCVADHDFEGWFRSSSDFDAQAERGLLACPECGSTAVERALMAPAVSTARAKAARAAQALSAPGASEAEQAATGGAAPTGADAPAGEAVPVALADPRAALMVEMLRRLRRHVEATAENVGGRFPEEARKIHYGEADARGIYGEASRDDVEALLDEGIEIHALPLLPEDRN